MLPALHLESALASPGAFRRAPRRPLPAVLLCDVDGTLVDTMPGFADVAARVLAGSHGIDRAEARALYLATCGRPFCEQVELLWPGDPRNHAAVETFEARKLDVSRRSRITAATAGALAALRDRGVRIVGSSSNAQRSVEAFARRSGFPFDLALGFGGGLRKGAPHVEAVRRAFGATGGAIVFVGDSLYDGDVADAQGIGFVGVAGTFTREQLHMRFPGAPVVGAVADLPALYA